MGVSKNTWIRQLPRYTQYKIEEELLRRVGQGNKHLSHEEIFDGMDGRICDIEEVISLEEITGWM